MPEEEVRRVKALRGCEEEAAEAEGFEEEGEGEK